MGILEKWPDRAAAASGHPTQAIIDLAAISANVSAIRERIGSERGLMAVVKADGYGHGAVPVAREALQSGADWLGVTFPWEGLALREAGIDAPILVLGPIHPEEAAAVVRGNLDQTIASPDALAALDHHARRARKRISVHLKVDTGMGRIGVAPERAVALAARISRFSHLRMVGVFSHLATADSADKSFALEQIASFGRVLANLERAGIEVEIGHLANSAAVLDLPEAWYDLVRPGTAIYGLYPSSEVHRSLPLRPAMSLVTRIAAVRTLRAGASVGYGRRFITRGDATRIAVLPIGYADGLNRALSGRWEVIIHDQRVPLVGTICMDMAMADVSSVSGVEPGDAAVLFGESPTAEEMASRIGTISYEIVCSIGQRLPRLFVRRSSTCEVTRSGESGQSGRPATAEVVPALQCR